MDVNFSDLHTESGLKLLDEFLSGKTYISGDQLTEDDVKVYGAVSHKVDAFPNVNKWYHCISSQLAASLPATAKAGVKIASQGAQAEEVRKEASAGDDEDDLDLFGDGTEEEKYAAKEREVSKAYQKERGKGQTNGD